MQQCARPEWATALEHTILCAMEANAGRPVPVVLSPDVDGLLSTVLVDAYLRQRHNTHVEIVAMYNARKVITSAESVDASLLKRALWLDLDVSFPGVQFTIGQHLLGVGASPPRAASIPTRILGSRRRT